MDVEGSSVKGYHPLDKYLRTDRLPHIWCPGCGLGINLGSIMRAIDRRVREGSLKRENIVFVTGIGCSARTSFYVNFDAAHTLHGRAVAFATGAKLAKPGLEMIIIGGDGDIAGIGGNHLIHAAKRNMDLIVVMVTNFVYAMTGGQMAPTTTPYGNPEPPLNAVKLISSLNPNYVARASVTHPPLIEQFMYRALGMKGFRFIEVLSTCPEIFGRHIGLRDPVTLYNTLRSKVVVKQNPNVEESELDWEKGFVLGEYIMRDNPSYLEILGRR
ncbi:MAG: thiamine pyrophosphate-dependent enzyme [Zestosphaera sp.]